MRVSEKPVCRKLGIRGNPSLIEWRKTLWCSSLERCWAFYRPFVVHLISKPMRSGEGVSWWTEVACTSTPDESLKNHLIIWRTASASPSKSASTRPSSVLRTQPRKPNSSACRRTRSRKVVSWTTLPEMKACERKRCVCSSLVSSRSPQQSSVWARHWIEPLLETSWTFSLGGIVAATL